MAPRITCHTFSSMKKQIHVISFSLTPIFLEWYICSTKDEPCSFNQLMLELNHVAQKWLLGTNPPIWLGRGQIVKEE